MPELMPGSRYVMVERLSSGPIGSVYKALDTILDRPVAIKLLRLDTPFADQSPDQLRERFVREARLVARLQHPNVVTIYDIDSTEDRGYIIMEFHESSTLEAMLQSGKRLPLSTAIRILVQVASALDYAHGRSVVHRTSSRPTSSCRDPCTYGLRISGSPNLTSRRTSRWPAVSLESRTICRRSRLAVTMSTRDRISSRWAASCLNVSPARGLLPALASPGSRQHQQRRATLPTELGSSLGCLRS